MSDDMSDMLGKGVIRYKLQYQVSNLTSQEVITAGTATDWLITTTILCLTSLHGSQDVAPGCLFQYTELYFV